MNAPTFQFTCPRCHFTQWVTAGNTTACVRCREPLATAVAQASVEPRGGLPLPSLGSVMGNAHARLLARPGGPRRKLLFGIGGAVVIAIAAIALMVVKQRFGTTKKGNLSYAQLGLDARRGDPDKMIATVAAPAKRWAKDAVWWAINLQALRADGTVDLTAGGAEVTYISPSRVSSLAKSTRKDSVKHFRFGMSGVAWGSIYGATSAWTNVRPPALPGCSIKQLTAILRDRGLVGGKTVRVTFDPKFNRMPGAPQEDSWHVVGKDPEIDAYYSMADCTPTKGG